VDGFLYATEFGLMVGPLNSPVQWIPNIRGPEVEAGHSSPYSSLVKITLSSISTADASS
jgi:hypothetical protein